MPGWPRTYRFLVDCDDMAVDEALVAAARQIDGPYLRYAVEVLLRRAQPAGLVAVIENYHRLPEDLRRLVLQSESALAPAMRSAIRDMQLQTRVNCLEIANHIGSESLAYLFDFGLMDTQARVRESAAQMMRCMSLRLMEEHPLLRSGQGQGAGGQERATADAGTPGRQEAKTATTPVNAQATANDRSTAAAGSGNGVAREPDHRLALRRHQLFEALLSGVQHYDVHLRPEVVEACLWFEPYLADKFWELLHQPRSRLPRLVADLMITSDIPQTGHFLVQALAAPELRPAGLKAVAERRDSRWFQGVLRGVEIWHSLARVRKAWGFIKEISYLRTVRDEVWPHLARSFALPVLVSASNLPAERKGDILCRLWRDGSCDCRRQVLLETSRGKDWAQDLLRIVLMESQDPHEVRTAAYELCQMGYPALAGDLIKRLSMLPTDRASPGILDLAVDEIFWRLWTHFDAMHEDRRVIALGLVRNHAARLRVRLRVNMASVSSSCRVRAVRMAGMLGLVEDLWHDVLAVAQDPNSRVRSAAVRLLGRSAQPPMKSALLAALDDKDGRVQANAIEAIDEAGWSDRLRLIVPKLHSENTRVRANAARALARAGDSEAAEALATMLTDPRVECRLTAVWTIKAIGGASWDATLQDLAEHDPSSAVRRFAQLVHRQLHGHDVAVSASDAASSVQPQDVQPTPPSADHGSHTVSQPSGAVSALQMAARKIAARQAMETRETPL